MNISYIIKMKTLVLIKWSYIPPPLEKREHEKKMLIVDSRHLIYLDT